MENCSEAHWKDVLDIISRAVEKAGFESRLVSSDTDSGVIQKRIVQNLYKNPIVICDISCRNPNVMFELGMRLAFDKPVVIVKDDKTPYSFDTSPIEHLEYPRDLRYQSVEQFVDRLSSKIQSAGRSGNSFLASFGSFKVAEIKTESIPAADLIVEQLKTIKDYLESLTSETSESRRRLARVERVIIDLQAPIKLRNALASSADTFALDLTKSLNALSKQDHEDNP